MPEDASSKPDSEAPESEKTQRVSGETMAGFVAREPGSHAVPCPRCGENAQRARDAEAQFQSMFLEAFEGLAISIDGIIIQANPALGALARCDSGELIGKSVLELTTPEDGRRVLEKIRAGERSPYEVLAVRPDGSTFPCEVEGRNMWFGGRYARLTTFHDLTRQKQEEEARKRVELRLQNAQKLESLGIVAGGVAHDFNNLLLVMLGHAELAMSYADPLVNEHLEKIRVAAQAASELTAQMLTFAGRGIVEQEAVSLAQVVRDVVELERPSLEHVQIDMREVALDVPRVRADLAQMKQVVFNLVVNAREALARRGGRISVRVCGVERSAEDLRELMVDASHGPGHFVLLEVEDDGCGMNSETLRRIFDPFFSTKFQGRGLGLAAVLGIVRGHYGAIGVESQFNAGSRFSLLFPLK